MGWLPPVRAAPPLRSVLKVGVSLAVTGPDAPRWGVPMLRGVELAVEDVNRNGGAGGHALDTVVLDSAGPSVEGISRWRGTNNYERFIADPTVIAAVGPQTSSEGRAVAVLLDRARMATITPSSTTFDMTDPALKDHFRPGGRAVYFRTVGTDLAQAEAMARFAHLTLGVRRVILVDDGSEFGGRMVETFERHGAAAGLTVIARLRLNWIHADYREELRRLGALGPDAVYFGVKFGVGVKLARQASGVLPSVHLLGADSLYNRALPIQARATGAAGWYVSHVAPDPAASPAAAAWADRFRGRFGAAPSHYSLTAYTAVTVIADAVGRLVKRGQPVTRASVRDAIQATRLPYALPGPVSFDAEGDLERPRSRSTR